MHQFALLDPRGFLCPLTSTSADSLRILVTRKLAAGWSYPPDAAVQLAPLHDEAQLAIPRSAAEAVPAPVAEPTTRVAKTRAVPAPKFDTPDDE